MFYPGFQIPDENENRVGEEAPWFLLFSSVWMKRDKAGVELVPQTCIPIDLLYVYFNDLDL